MVLALPTLLVRSPPMTDLPMHEGIVGLLLHWGDAAFVPPGLYALNLGHANQLFCAVAYLLVKGFGPRVGFAIAAALPQVVIVGGAGHAARHMRAPWWAALWVAPVALGWVYFWGLVAQLYGLALFLPVVVALDRLVQSPCRRRAAVVALGYAGLFFAHEIAMAAALAVHGVLVLVERPRASWGRIVWPAAVPIALGAADAFWLQRIQTATEHAYAGDVKDDGPLAALVRLPESVFGSYPVPILLALVGIYVAAVVLTGRSPRTEAKDGVRRHRLLIAGAALLAAALLAPDQLDGVTMLGARFASFAWMLLLPACASGNGFVPESSPRLRIAVLASVAPLLALPMCAAGAFADSDRTNQALDRLIAHMQTGQAVFVQRLRPASEDDLYNAISCGRVVAQRGGRCHLDFTRTSIAPLRMTESLMWPRVDGTPEADGRTELRPFVQLRAYRYLALCCASLQDAAGLSAVLAPAARQLAFDDGWVLYESKLPRIAPNAPESDIGAGLSR